MKGQPAAARPSPPLGAGRQRRHRRGGQVRANRVMQQGRRLLRGEPQVGGAQLGQVPTGPQPGQRQRRVGPAGQHQVQARRQVIQQERQRRVHLQGVDQVVIINDQQHLAVIGPGGQVVNQRCHQPLEGCRGPAGPAGGRLSPRSPGAPGPARPPRDARTAPGRCRLRPATARPPAGYRTGPAASRAVLPNPAGAHTRMSRRASPSPSACTSRGRGTNPGRGRGTWSLVASSTSGPEAAAPDGAAADGSAISDPPLSAPGDSQPSPQGEPIVSPARLASWGGRGCGCHLQTAAGLYRSWRQPCPRPIAAGQAPARTRAPAQRAQALAPAEEASRN